MVFRILPGEGREGDGVFGVDAAFDGVAVDDDFLLRHWQVAAGGDADLLQHEVDIGDHLGDGMFDLDAGVHLDEVEFAVLVEEFDGADAEIFHLLHRLGAGGADPGRAGRIERGRGAFLPDLLVAPLQRAVALAEMDGAAAAIAEHLDFDVARLLQIFFEIDRGVAERRSGLVGGGRKRQHQIVRCVRDLHAASAAARSRLHQHRKADRLCDRHGVVVGADRAVGAGHHGNGRASWRSSWPRSCRPSGGCARPSAR